MKASISISVLLLAGLPLFFINCSRTNFAAMASQAEQQMANEDLPVEVTSVIEMPKITTSIPDCQPNTMCRIIFNINQAHTLAVKFKWRTDDDTNSKWKTDVLPPNVIWGVAGTHYVSGEGEITFEPGETNKSIVVQNINQSANGIRLKVLINNCFLGTGSYRCQLFF